MIAPALTPEEWKEALRDRASMAGEMQRAWQATGVESEHKMAALSLVYRPFGFTHDDIKLLTLVTVHGVRTRDEFKQMDDLAGRIAALLPPKR